MEKNLDMISEAVQNGDDDKVFLEQFIGMLDGMWKQLPLSCS